VQDYIVESYLSRRRGPELVRLARRAREATDHLVHEGKRVRYLRSTYLSGDEVCLHWFSASTEELVREAVVRAAIDCDRLHVADTIERRQT
jgi:aminoglycoside phosphotransferase